MKNVTTSAERRTSVRTTSPTLDAIAAMRLLRGAAATSPASNPIARASTITVDQGNLHDVSSRFGFKDEAALFDDQPQPYGEVFMMRADWTEQRPLTDNQWEDGPGRWKPSKTVCR